MHLFQINKIRHTQYYLYRRLLWMSRYYIVIARCDKEAKGEMQKKTKKHLSLVHHIIILRTFVPI